MSDPVISFQNQGFIAQSTASATVVALPEVPPEIAELPAGSIVSGVIQPPENPSDSPVLQLNPPDGKQVDIPVKPGRVVLVPTPVSVKVLPFDPKKGMTVRINFSAPPPPDINKAIKNLPEAIRTETDFSTVPDKQTVSVRAFVLSSVPERISAVANTLESPADEILPPALKPHQSVRLELSPPAQQTPATVQEQTVLPTITKENPADLPTAVKTPERTAVPAETPVPREAPVVRPSTSPDGNPQTAIPTTGRNAFPAEQPIQQATVAPAEQNVAPIPNLPTQENMPANTSPVIKENVMPAVSAERTVEQSSSAPVRPDAVAVDKTPSPLPENKNGQPAPATSFALPPAEKQTENFPARIPLRGVVFDFKERSAPLIVTKIGVLALEEKIQLPHLTPVTVEITGIAEPPSFVLPEQRDETAFQAFREALAGLQKSDPAAFESLKSILPQTGVKLPALIHTFITAASQGVPLASFIGEANAIAIQNLGEKGRTLISAMEKEFSASSKKVSDGRSSWQAWSIPILSGAVVEPVSLYLQRPQEDARQQKGAAVKPNAVRFVLDLNLSKLGKLQMDGLAHGSERRFDLIVRHQDDLPASFDEKVRQIFTQTLSALNYTGTVKTDHTDQFIVLTEEAENKPKSGVWA